ncbi:MAG: hypothetical protein LBL90_08425, partial [Prevotellaceae bacterium]|nr:hypothetical protein [Prevotellaceae bacterium]
MLTVVCETAEIGGGGQTLLFYINDVPVNYRSARLMGGSVVYSVGTNIARTSNAPGMDDLDAYNSWAARTIEGTWEIVCVEKRKYHIWNDLYHEEQPYEEGLGETHAGCREVFKHNSAKV